MSIEENKKVVSQFFTIFYGKWDINQLDLLFHKDHSLLPHPGLPTVNLKGQATMFYILKQAFPDMKFQIKKMIAEEDTVCVYWKATGTHLGDWFGIAGTGNSVSIRGTHIFEFREGKIIQIYLVYDTLTLFLQLDQVSLQIDDEIRLKDYLETIKNVFSNF